MGRWALAILAGHCWVHSLAELPASRPWAWVLAILIVVATAARFQVVAAALLGFGWAWGHAALRIAEDLPTSLEGRDLEVRGYVASIPDPGADVQFTFDVVEASDGVPRRIRLVCYRCPIRPCAAEPWRLVVRMKRRNGLANPGGFDYEGHLFREGVGASGYVRDDPMNLRLGNASLRYPILRLRAWLAQRIARAIPHSATLGILQGLAIGDTQAMTPAQWRTFAMTGTTHLMAISGLHITMVAALAAWLGGRIVHWPTAQAKGWTARQGRVVAGSGAAIAYSLLAGFSVPTQRTLIMLCIYFGARAARRNLSAANALGLALIGVLLIDPFAPLASGAWLSFGAVCIILLAVGGRVRPDGVIAGFARVQWAITIALTPVLLSVFGAISLASPIANAVAVPAFTLVIVPLVLLGTLVAALSATAGGWILAVPVEILERSWTVLEWLGNTDASYWHAPQLPVSVVLALVAGVALLVLPGIHATRLAGLMLCVPSLLYRPAAPAPGEFELALIDVGQGLSVVVRTAQHVLVYDAGPAFRTGRDAGEVAVLPYLHARGIRGVDLLVVSHADLDHRGGARSLLQGVAVERVLVGPSVVDLAPGEPCRRGQRWHWDGVSFEVLHPSEQRFVRDNDSSCVLHVSAASGSALLAGDIQADAEQALMSSGLPASDVVVVPHHGSRTSSSAALVDAAGARYALISAGYRNRWDLPNDEIVERWRSRGARTYVTADSGALEASFSASGPRVREYRREHRRYWRR